MGTRERRQREFAEREALFLDAALHRIREDGLLGLQMSGLAEKAEYAVGTLYLHFSSKEDLLLALATRIVQDYLELLRKASAWKASSRERMLAIAVADIVFQRRHPDYFRISQYCLCEVAWSAASETRRHAFQQANLPTMNIVARIIEDACRAGDLDAEGASAQELAIGVWSLCSGYANISHAEGLLEMFTVNDPNTVLCRQVQSLLDGYGWKPLSGPTSEHEIKQLIQRIGLEVFQERCNEK